MRGEWWAGCWVWRGANDETETLDKMSYTASEGVYAVAGLMHFAQAPDLRGRNRAQQIKLATAYTT